MELDPEPDILGQKGLEEYQHTGLLETFFDRCPELIGQGLQKALVLCRALALQDEVSGHRGNEIGSGGSFQEKGLMAWIEARSAHRNYQGGRGCPQ